MFIRWKGNNKESRVGTLALTHELDQDFTAYFSPQHHQTIPCLYRLKLSQPYPLIRRRLSFPFKRKVQHFQRKGSYRNLKTTSLRIGPSAFKAHRPRRYQTLKYHDCKCTYLLYFKGTVKLCDFGYAHINHQSQSESEQHFYSQIDKVNKNDEANECKWNQ